VKNKLNILKKINLFLVVFCVFIIGCSDIDNNKKEISNIKKTKATEKKILESVKHFLEQYKQGYETKQTSKILSLYSDKADKSLLTQSGLTEYFELSDKINFNYDNVKIKNNFDDRVIINSDFNISYVIDNKTIKDNKNVDIILFKQKDSYKLLNFKTVKIY
jgi:hypothetical protein